MGKAELVVDGVILNRIEGKKQKKEEKIIKYLTQASYPAEALSAMISNPQNRGEVVRQIIEKRGGRLEGWFAFGDYDVVHVFEMPDNVSAAAFSMAVSAGGALKALKTTQLITP